MTRLPALIARADWSKDPRKRWVAVARCSGEGGRYDVEATRPVGNTGALLRLLREAADGGPVLMGFDFPIGLPMAYARRVGVTSFRELLLKLGCEEPWGTFFELARKPGEIGLGRPFYPWAPGGTRRADLVSALGLMSADDLYRECERRVESPSAKRPSETRGASGRDPTPAVKSRAAASPLFWTLGAQQVGRAAIVGWREMLQPALKDAGSDTVGLWPFDGALGELLETRRTLISETYPAAAYLDLGLTEDGRRWSKRRPADRRHQGAKLAQWADRNEVTLGSEARGEVESGFGEGGEGEDRFDARQIWINAQKTAALGTAAAFRVPTAGDYLSREMLGEIFHAPRRCLMDLSPKALLARFQKHLTDSSYTRTVVAHHVDIAEKLLRYLSQIGPSAETITEDDVARYLTALIQRYRRNHLRSPRSMINWCYWHTNGIHPFLRFVQGRWPPPPVPANERERALATLLTEYRQYLRERRALAATTIYGQAHEAQRFLQWLPAIAGRRFDV